MNRNGPEDARFHELMAREFPDGLTPAQDRGGSAGADRSEPPATARTPSAGSPSAGSPPTGSPSAGSPVSAADDRPVDLPSDFRSWTPPDEPEEPFTPPPPPPARRWSAAGIAGTALVVLPLLLVLMAAFGVQFPTFVSVLAGLGFFLGVFLLLHRLRRRPPVDGDGAVV